MPDACDYALLRQEFSGMFTKGRSCVISVDLDGVLSAVLMAHLFEWDVVGTYDANNLWVLRRCLPSGSICPETAMAQGKFVFLDHDVYRTQIDSIGHHMLQWSADTPIPLHTDGRSTLNPNLLRGISYSKDFNRKYPYSTLHFLLACASAWGLLGNFKPDEEFSTLLLHVDSSFFNAMNYKRNALDWLSWLGGSEDTSPLYPICRSMLRFTPRTIIQQFLNLEDRLTALGVSPKPSASLVQPSDQAKMRGLENLLAWVERETGWKGRMRILDPEEKAIFVMDRRASKPNKCEFVPVVARRPFSYAIIDRSDSGLNYNWFAGFAP